MISILVLDEADRMVEAGHFREMENILDFIYSKKAKKLGLFKVGENSTKDEEKQKIVDFFQKQETGKGKSMDGQFSLKLLEENKTISKNGGLDNIQDLEEEVLGKDQNCIPFDEANLIIHSDEEKEVSKSIFKKQQIWKSIRGRKLDIQTFVCSATLTLDDKGRGMFKTVDKNEKGKDSSKRKQKQQKSFENRLQIFYDRLKFRGKPLIVNLSAEQLFPKSKITQSYTFCKNQDQKQHIVYHFLQDKITQTESALIFLNSLSSVKKLFRLLQLLEIDACVLHASMQQRQRIKQLERFKNRIRDAKSDDNSAKQKQKSEEKKITPAVMVATDVAARGLHIPDVNHIIHFQIPKTTQLYLNRIGRSARVGKSGNSLAIVSPQQAKDFKQICKYLELRNKAELISYEISVAQLQYYSNIINKAKVLEKSIFQQKKLNNSNQWIQKLAKSADLDASEIIDETQRKMDQIKRVSKFSSKQEEKKLKQQKAQFKRALENKEQNILSKSTFMTPERAKFLNSLDGKDKKNINMKLVNREFMSKPKGKLEFSNNHFRKKTTKTRQKKRHGQKR